MTPIGFLIRTVDEIIDEIIIVVLMASESSIGRVLVVAGSC